MPPKIKHTKEKILQKAYELARRRGIDAVNARALASELGCSTQPLFREFNSMDDIRAEIVRLARAKYEEYLTGAPARAELKFKGMGLSYIAFARDEPELFKLVFMRDRSADGTMNVPDRDAKEIISALMQQSGLSLEKAELLHLNSWIYAHGLAVMLATRYIEVTEEQLGDLLSMQFSALLAKIKEMP